MMRTAVATGIGKLSPTVHQGMDGNKELVMFQPSLAQKPLALAWPEGALAFPNPGPSQRPQYWLGPGLALAQARAFVNANKSHLTCCVWWETTVCLPKEYVV